MTEFKKRKLKNVWAFDTFFIALQKNKTEKYTA